MNGWLFGIDSYRRFCVPVWDGKATRTVRIVAEQSKDGIRVDPNAFDIYEVIQEPGAPADGNQASQPVPLVGGHQKTPPEAARPRTISIRQMLTGIKDMKGKVYFQNGRSLAWFDQARNQSPGREPARGFDSNIPTNADLDNGRSL